MLCCSFCFLTDIIFTLFCRLLILFQCLIHSLLSIVLFTVFPSFIQLLSIWIKCDIYTGYKSIFSWSNSVTMKFFSRERERKKPRHKGTIHSFTLYIWRYFSFSVPRSWGHLHPGTHQQLMKIFFNVFFLILFGPAKTVSHHSMWIRFIIEERRKKKDKNKSINTSLCRDREDNKVNDI